jgi:hypothetical protein
VISGGVRFALWTGQLHPAKAAAGGRLPDHDHRAVRFVEDLITGRSKHETR